MRVSSNTPALSRPTNVIKLSAVRRTRERAKPKEAHPARDLSFMRFRKPRGTGIDYWFVSPTGNYSIDFDTGSKLAKEYLAYIGEHPIWLNGALLTSIVRDMIDGAKAGQEWSGIHVGFVRGVNRYAMAAAAVIAASRNLDGGAA